MGITGLLPFLEKKKSSQVCNIKEFSGCTVAADAYCWLHKGAFACADKLARGEPTNMYVQYCMKYVNMLLSHNIKPILVFDGRHLPAKAQTEKKRRERRQENKSQAAALLRQGRAAEARTYLQRCIDVTHSMALALMKECRSVNVDCIVAPHEADAQLAFFSIEGIADLIITEDSDLLLFGCKKVMFKLDLSGNGVLVEQEKLNLCMGGRNDYSFDKFRHMCILSGCDYLDSLPGIGLTKACQFVTRTQDPDIHRALGRLPYQLNMKGLSVSVEYRDDFIKADAMFRHQLVFDPRTRKTKPLTPYPAIDPASPLAGGPLPGCKPEFEDSVALQLALGNIDPMSMQTMDTFDPDAPTEEKKVYYNQPISKRRPSIWGSAFYEEEKKKPAVIPSFMEVNSRPVEHQSTSGKTKSLNVDCLKKRKRETDENTCSAADVRAEKKQAIEESKMLTIYSSSIAEDSEKKPTPENSTFAQPTSPILTPKRIVTNPFALRNGTKTSQPVFGNKLSPHIQSPNEGAIIVQSRYFRNAARESSMTPPPIKNLSSPSPQRTPTRNDEDAADQRSPLCSPEGTQKARDLIKTPPQRPAPTDPEVTDTYSCRSPEKGTRPEIVSEKTDTSAEKEQEKPAMTKPTFNVEVFSKGTGILGKAAEKREISIKPPKPLGCDDGDNKQKKTNVISPKMAGGVKKQGLLSSFGFKPKSKMQKN